MKNIKKIPALLPDILKISAIYAAAKDDGGICETILC